MTSYPGNQSHFPIYDINLVGMQLQSLQQQMTEYSRVVSQQQQAIMQLLQQQHTTTNTAQWPLVRNQNFPNLMDQKRTKNNTSSPSTSQVQRKPGNNPRKRAPKERTLGDFIPVQARNGQKKGQKHVRFTEDVQGRKGTQKKKGKKMKEAKADNNKKQVQVVKKTNVQKTNDKMTDKVRLFNIPLDNRFL